MSKIYGDSKTIDRVKNSKPGDLNVLVNLEAIEELPEQFEVHLEKVNFNFEKDFSEVGNGNFMPSPSLMNEIARARGIEGTSDIKIEAIKEEVDINPLLCKPIESEPILRKIIIGKRVIKTGKVLTEDGTYRTSDPCSVDFNVWERCLIDWAKEEEYTNGYDSSIVETGEYEVFGKKKHGKHYTKGKWTFELKYDNKYKRQRHMAELMKFAQRQADTKARHVVIRVLARLQTGYTRDELKNNYFIFPKIRRSRVLLKMETAADLQARSRGLTTKGDQSSQLLFGNVDKAEPIKEETEIIDFPTEEKKEISKREHMIAILKAYQKDDLIVSKYQGSVENLLIWLEKTENAETHTEYWDKGLNILKHVEMDIPEQMRIDHKLYEGGQG